MLNRRLLLAGSAAALAFPRISYAANGAIAIRCGALSPGFTSLFFDYIIKKGIDRKNGVKLETPIQYTSLYSFHNDFASGTFDLALGSWDTFAVRHAGGVPIKLLSGLTTADMIGIMVANENSKTLQDLTGKVLAGPQGSGVYRMVRAVVKETRGFDLENSMTIQNIDAPPTAVSMLLAARVDAAIAWEPNISFGTTKQKDLRVIFNSGEAYREKFGLELPFLGAAIRNDVFAQAPDAGRRINSMLKNCIDDLNANPGLITSDIAANTNVSMPVIQASIASNRLRFKFLNAGEGDGRKTFSAASDFLFQNKAFTKAVAPDFFIDA